MFEVKVNSNADSSPVANPPILLEVEDAAGRWRVTSAGKNESWPRPIIVEQENGCLKPSAYVREHGNLVVISGTNLFIVDTNKIIKKSIYRT